MRIKLPGKALAVALAVSAAFGFAASLISGSKLLSGLSWKMYDSSLPFAPRPPAPRELVAIYPGSHSEGLIRSRAETLPLLRLLDEFEVRGLAFTGENLAGESESEAETLAAIRSELPNLIDRETGSIKENIQALFGAIRSGSVAPHELGGYVTDLAGVVDKGGLRIKEALGEGQSQTLRALDTERLRFLSPGPSLSALKADSDHVLRRLPLMTKTEGDQLPSLELATLMCWFGDPSLHLAPGRVILQGLKLPGAELRDLAIPVDTEERVLLRWPLPRADDGPRSLALEELVGLIGEEAAFISSLETLATGRLLLGEGAALPSRYHHAEQLGEDRAAEDATANADWREARRDFFAAAKAYFEGKRESELLEPLEAEKARSDPGAEEGALIDSRISQIQDSYDQARGQINKIAARRAVLSESLRGSLAILSLDDGKQGLETSFGSAASPAYAAAVFISEALSSSSPFPVNEGRTRGFVLAADLVATAAFLLLSPAAALALGLCLGLAGSVFPLMSLAVQGAFIPALSLAPGPIVTALAAFFLLRRAASSDARSVRRKMAVVAFKAPGLLRSVEGLTPEGARRAAGQFRALVGSAIKTQGGRVAASDGASILSWFEESDGGRSPAERGIKAAFGAQRESRALAARGGIDPELRIGIDLGDCVLDSRALGFWRRGAAALLGPVPDLALRLADLNSHYGTRLLITGAALERLGEGITRRHLGEIVVEATGRGSSLYSAEESGDEGPKASPGTGFPLE